MAKAIDIGTCFLVGAELRNGNEEFITERNAFFSMPNEDFAEEMLNRADAAYLKRESNNTLYVVGQDALQFSLITGNKANYRRPMQDGVLNPGEEEAISMMQVMIEGLIGKASYPGEVVAVTIPANPLDGDFNTTYHKMILERFLRDLGYEVKIINESLALIYAENPSVESNGATIPFTGIGISFGAGMVNLVASWRAKKLLDFSVSRGGDWIDKEVAKVRGIPISKVTHLKETRLDFTQPIMDPTLRAVEIYYEDLIRYVLEQFAVEFKNTSAYFEEPIEIILGGGTAAVPGMLEKFNAVLETVDLPMTVKNVRLAKDPLKSVASGALVAAISEEKKIQRSKAPAPQSAAKIYSGTLVDTPSTTPTSTPTTTTPPVEPVTVTEDPAFSTTPRQEMVTNVDSDENFTLNNEQ